MDHGSFDRIARLLAAAGSRRAALGALLGVGALGVSEAADARNKNKKRRNSKNRNRNTGQGAVSAQAVCAPPSNGVNRSNCDYTNQDFSGQLIHSSIYKNTIFRNADLIETDLHSSNMNAANFRDADLCSADLSSSNLRNANFRDANLTNADLSSSSCGGTNFTAGTVFCQTKTCDGTIDNSDCGSPAATACLTDTCACELVDLFPGPGKACTTFEGACNFLCSTIADCPTGWLCVTDGLCPGNAAHCHPPCTAGPAATATSARSARSAHG